MSERWEALGGQENELWWSRLMRWLGGEGQPALGWSVLITVAALSTLPAVVVFASGWLPRGRFEASLLLLGPLAVVIGWALAGWRGRQHRTRIIRIAIISILFLSLGVFVITNLLSPWLPSLATLQNAWATQDGSVIAAAIVENWGRLAARYVLWGAGVANAAAPRDNLVLATVVAVLTWLLAGATVALARATRRGLLTALPILWISGLLLLYSPAERWVFLSALALALILHLLLSQQHLVESWRRRNLDYSPMLFVEQGGWALAVAALLLAMAALVPNLYIYAVTARYYALLEPLNNQLEAGVERLFPGLARGGSPWASVGQAGGMPNQFLLGAGPEALERPVMRVRTSEPLQSYEAPPRWHHLRGATYAEYDGLGWDNPAQLTRTQHEAETAWSDNLPGLARRILLQSVNLEGAAAILFAAGEPLAPAVSYAAVTRAPDDLVALNSPARSYTVQSAIPALDEAALMALPWWDAEHPLPADLAPHLDLPPTVTARTRELAARLVASATSPYAAATAIEAHLRTFPYDLDVLEPPPEVTDVADYFLFDLQRGYCDYYATAFVVLARAAGLPARFATGFAAGDWMMAEQQWVITEADAHSWPEVYLPEAGWIAFEPTAAQPQPLRIGAPAATASEGGAAPSLPLEPPPPLHAGWLIALTAGAVLAAAFLVWRARRQTDPWQAVLAWGGRAGAPLGEGETPREYSGRLAAMVQTRAGQRNPELARIAGRELRELGETVSRARYAPLSARGEPARQLEGQWRRLRHYLRQVE